jgi:molecular chaperone GrpE
MLKTIEQQLRELQQKIEQIGSTPPPPSPSSTPSITISDVETAVQNGVETAVQNGLAGLEKQISRSGREQLKANTLSETQLERLSAALDALRENEATREKDMEALRQQIDESRAQGRLEMAQAILPALDSIDEALRSGQAVLAKPNEPQQTPTIFDRLRGQVPAKPGSDRSLREAINSWLVGLTFVQQRLFDILQAEGIHPIETNEKPFDPQVHVVIDVVPASTEHPAGMVVNELRRGYLVGTRVLRHAEVVVAKPDNEMSFEKQ